MAGGQELVCCISLAAGGYECFAFNGLQVAMRVLHFKGCRWAFMCCISWVAGECVTFLELQVGMNLLHFG